MNQKNIKLKFAFCLLTFLLAALLSVNPCSAQDTRGTIKGAITDPNKSPIPGAVVKVIDPSRGSSVTLTTNDEGLYQANYVFPGTYRIEVEFAGFKKVVRENVTLQINQTVQVDIPLEVGGAAETVTIRDEVPQLDTAKADLGLSIDAKRISELPLVHGDPYTLIGLTPGTTFTGDPRLDRPFEPTHIVGYAVDGTRGNRSDLTIDGAPSTATANANEIIATYVPPTDIIQEFKVQTATFDAQFGNTEGGVTSISIKSGTNDLHGAAYYFGEPGNLAANDFFGNSRGQARPTTKSDRFGASINGPVWIPKLYNGKNRTFFLFGYEGIRDSRPRFDAGASVFVPTAALASGDFTGLGVTIYDPLTRVNTGTASSPVYTGTAFALNKIPTDRISPVAKAVLGYFGSPKQSGLLGNIFDSTLAEKTKPYDNFTFRIDQNISEKNHFFVRGSWYNRNSLYNNYTGTPYIGVNFVFKSRQAVIDDTYTLNPTTFINFKFGYNRFIRGQDQREDARGFDLTKLGFSAAFNSLIPDVVRRFPRFDFPANSILGNGMSNEFRPVDTQSYSSTLNKVIGSHSLKFGGELRIYREDDSFKSNDQTAQFVFDNTYTRQASNGSTGADVNGLQAFASFLLGLPTTMQIVRRADYSEYSKTYGFFAQDDWRINSRLTLNLGLRYEVESALVERNNKSVSGFDFSYVQPIQAAARAKLTSTPIIGYNGAAIDPNSFNVAGGLLFEGKDTGKGLYNTPKDGFLPRFGAAFKLNDKTVLRGGFGLFQGFLGERRGDVIQPGYTTTSVLGNTALASGAPLPNAITSFPSISIVEPTGNVAGRQTSLGSAISFFNQNPKASKQFRYQVGFQRELPFGFVLEMSYVGNYGYNIEISRNINALSNQYLNGDNFLSTAQTANNTLLAATVANPFAGLLPGTSFNNATIARSQLLKAFPEFGDITTSNNDGKSWYQSGELLLQKRFSKGYTVQASYTRSKWIQATEYLNAGDAKPTKMISDQDVPNKFSMSAMYALPFGKGQLFFSNAGGVLDRIINGFQLQGIYTHQSGLPIAFSNDLFYVGGSISIDNRTPARWFNTDAFLKVTPVNHLRTLPLRFSDVRRDALNEVNFSLLKDVRLREKMKLKFTFELINAFNEPYFPAPVVNPTASNFGQISASNQANYARRVQTSIKFVF